MRMRPKKIDQRCLPMRSPFILTLLFWLVLDRYNPAGWVWGFYFATCIIFWAGWFHALFNTEFINLFKEEEKTDHNKLEQILRRTSYYVPPNQKVQ